MSYTPRRQSARWLDADCPAEVLAIYDNGGTSSRNGSFDRYTVFYVPTDLSEGRGSRIDYRGMSEQPSHPQGFGILDDMPAYEAAAFRYRFSHHACRWSDLPSEVKAAVRRDCQAIRASAA